MKKNANEKDPWGLEYTKQNTAGSGAYKVTRWTRRHRSGPRAQRRLEAAAPQPKVQPHHLAHGAVGRQPPRAARARRRRHLLRAAEQGFRRAARRRASSAIVSTPFGNGIQYIGMNVTKPPFDNLKVRQAVAYAIPYQKIMDAVLFGLAKPMFGASRRRADPGRLAAAAQVTTPTSPRRSSCSPRPAIPTASRRRISFDLGFAVLNEPLCVLLQESLGADRHQGRRSTRSPAPTGAPSSTRRRCRSTPTCSRAGSTIPSTSSSGAITARIPSSTP